MPKNKHEEKKQQSGETNSKDISYNSWDTFIDSFKATTSLYVSNPSENNIFDGRKSYLIIC